MNAVIDQAGQLVSGHAESNVGRGPQEARIRELENQIDSIRQTLAAVTAANKIFDAAHEEIARWMATRLAEDEKEAAK